MLKLVLGTVQLGMPYGVANRTGQPDFRTAVEIIRVAWENGIQEFDTAQEYGESERMLGVAFRKLGIADKACVVSKLRKDINLSDETAVIGAVKESLVRLGVKKMYGLLAHKEEWSEDEMQGMRAVGDQGFVDHVGVSVYSPERALRAIAVDGIDIVQIPSNIVDRRFERARVFERAKAAGKTLYIRSVFLQGLLLMSSMTLPAHMGFAREVVERAGELAHALGVTRQALALHYVKTAFPEARVIVGAETSEQVRENIAAWNTETPRDVVACVRESFKDVNERLLDPRTWSRA